MPFFSDNAFDILKSELHKKKKLKYINFEAVDIKKKK